ncbi:MAG: DUF4232 domain-containing protein [Trebonia sp.]
MSPGHLYGAAGRSGGGQLPTCGPDDVSVTVHWERDGGRLRGRVTVENTGGRTCRLPGKPGVRPLGLDGTPLPVETVITLEMRHPGYVDLEPGQRAAAEVGWGGWNGASASPRAQVSWQGCTAVAPVEGPAQPASAQPPCNIFSSWFRLPG